MIEKAADEFDEIVVLIETTEGVVDVQRRATFAQHHRLIKSRGQAAPIAEIVQSLMFRIRLILDGDHFRTLRLFEESLENANGIMRTHIDALLHEVEDALQPVGLDQIGQQKAELVRSFGRERSTSTLSRRVRHRRGSTLHSANASSVVV